MKCKTFLLASFLALNSFIISDFSQGQWIQTSGPSGGYVECLSNINSVLYAGMLESGIFRSSDNGLTWTGVNNGLRNLMFNTIISSGNGIYTGTCDGLFYTSNEGQEWNCIGLTNSVVLSVAITGNYIFAGTYQEGLFISTNNGANWTSSNSGIENLYIMTFYITGTNLLAGTSNGLYISTNYGANWTRTGTGIPTGSGVRSIAVSGSNFFAATGSGVYLSSDNGATFIAVNTGLYNHNVESIAILGQNIFAGTWGNGVYMSTNNGGQWAQTSNGLTEFSINSVITSGAKVFAGTGVDGIFVTTNSGQLWSPINYGLANETILSVYNYGTTLYAGTSRGLFYSTDNGTNWFDGGIDSTIIFSIIASGNYIFAGSFGDGIYRSTDNGYTWSLVNNGLTDLRVKKLITNGVNIYAVTETYSYLSTDYGAHWVSINNGPPYYYIWDLTVTNNDIFAAFTNKTVYRSTNNGLNWSIASSGLPDSFLRTIGSWDNRVFVGTSDNGVYSSTNNGVNWLPVNYGINNRDVNVFAFSGTNTFVGTDSGVFLSTNYGTNWIKKNQGFTVPPYISSLTSSNDFFFAGTHNRSVWKRLLSDIVDVSSINIEVPLSFIISQNYPNPFNPVTFIQFSLPSNEKVSLKIFDIMGREIETLIDKRLQPGTYQTEFDGTNYSSGVYFYRITAGKYTETRKMVLVK